jgi:predicted ATP-binding protein involved in virulence
MRIESVDLTNYRCHRQLQVEFSPGFNVIVGINGIGKTSLLKAICDSLYGFLVRVQGTHHIEPLSELGTALLEMSNIDGRFRFEPQYPIKVGAAGAVFGIGCFWTCIKTDQMSHATWRGATPGEQWSAIQQNADPSRLAATQMPLLAFYRANRNWNSTLPDTAQAAAVRSARGDGYLNWSDASLDFRALQTWVIGKSLERFQMSSETGALFEDIENDELALVNFAVASAVEGAKGLRYDMRSRSLLVDWKESSDGFRDPTFFENLSDGQRAVIGLVADIARRMCLLNPQLGQEVTQKTEGVVLIDELDMHLHPQWQRRIVTGLKAAFPAIQFIVASHSPQLLGELHPEEIILLRAGGTSHPQVSYGMDSSRVLEEIMGATARTPAIDEAVSNLFAALERNELPAARDQLTALSKQAPGIAELVGAEALLKRKELLGR